MSPNLKLKGYCVDQDVALPNDLDAIGVETSNGVIYIEPTEPFSQMINVRAVTATPQASVVRLNMSPMQCGQNRPWQH